MLVFVDFEHPSGYDREYGTKILAARTWITYRLEDLAGAHCHLVRYDRIDPSLLTTLGATAIFVSGNSVSPDVYEPGLLEPLYAVVRETELPVFGFCGGHQAVALALGAAVVPLPDAASHADDPTMTVTDDGLPFEYGYHPVEIADGADLHPLLAGIDEPVFRHAHGLHVPHLPDGFENLASTAITPNQLAVHEDRLIVGTQFHPEYWTDEHPAGRTLIANFLRWSGVS